MTTYYSESFFRGQITEKITNTQALPFTIKISKTPSIPNGLLTISPDTEFEEIVEYTTTGIANEISIVKRGIKPSATSLLINGNDYNNTTYFKTHSVGDLIRGDANNIHLNQIIDIVAGVTVVSQYDAVVSASGGTHTSLVSAIGAGKKNILIKQGSYTEASGQYCILTSDVTITGEQGSSVTFTGLTNQYAFSGAYNINIKGGTYNVEGGTSIGFIDVGNAYIDNATITFKGTGSAGINIAKQSVASTNRYFTNCNILGINFGTSHNVVFNVSDCDVRFLNCYIKFDTQVEGTSGFKAKYIGCTIVIEYNTLSRIYNSDSEFTSCYIYYGKDFTFNSSSKLVNCQLIKQYSSTGGQSHSISGTVIGGSLSDAEVVNDITFNGKVEGLIIQGTRRLTINGSMVNSSWVSSVYTGAASVVVNAGAIFNGNNVNTKSTVAGSASVAGIFTSNIAADDTGTFTTSGAGVIANNQLS